MQRFEIVKSKIHRVTVRQADLNSGSITLDRDLIDAANLIVGEKVQVLNIITANLKPMSLRAGVREMLPSMTTEKYKQDVIIMVNCN